MNIACDLRLYKNSSWISIRFTSVVQLSVAVCAIITRDTGSSSGNISPDGGCAIHSFRETILNGPAVSVITSDPESFSKIISKSFSCLFQMFGVLGLVHFVGIIKNSIVDPFLMTNFPKFKRVISKSSCPFIEIVNDKIEIFTSGWSEFFNGWNSFHLENGGVLWRGLKF